MISVPPAASRAASTPAAPRFLTRASLVAALAGLLFGLDIAYVNGSLHLIAAEFRLDIAQQGDVAGYLLVGAAVGALGGGWLARRHGRKPVLVAAGALFVFGTLFLLGVHSFALLLVGRFAIGLGVGAASFVAPLYLSEIAPYRRRGALIAYYELAITGGIVLMFASNAALAPTGSWRLMLAVLLLPSAALLLGTVRLPESPRWLALSGDFGGARHVLERIRGSADEVKFELDEITQALSLRQRGTALLAQPAFVRAALLGVALQALQQFSGMNAFMYYSGQILLGGGVTDPTVGTLLIGSANVAGTVVAIRWIDRWGRRPFLYCGLGVMVLACLILGALLDVPGAGGALRPALLTGSAVLFVFSFATSLGPVVWVMCSEVMPLEWRDLGVMLSTASNWICNSVMGKFSLIWFSAYGAGPTFWGFAAVCLAGIVMVRLVVPETRGVPLEELEFDLRAGRSLRSLGARPSRRRPH